MVTCLAPPGTLVLYSFLVTPGRLFLKSSDGRNTRFFSQFKSKSLLCSTWSVYETPISYEAEFYGYRLPRFLRDFCRSRPSLPSSNYYNEDLTSLSVPRPLGPSLGHWVWLTHLQWRHESCVFCKDLYLESVVTTLYLGTWGSTMLHLDDVVPCVSL